MVQTPTHTLESWVIKGPEVGNSGVSPSTGGLSGGIIFLGSGKLLISLELTA